MLHPVGPLPARVYWRRRLVVLGALLAVLGAGTWGGIALLTGGSAGPRGITPEAAEPAPTPALERVVPSLGAVRTPAAPEPETAVPPPEETVAAAPQPEAGGPCGDDALAVEVRSPGSAAVGSKPLFELVVVNTSAVPCVRDLDKALQELILVDGTGQRVWGSNDCFPESGTDVRTLAPGEPVVFPVRWGGLTSAPDCAGERTPPPAGSYAVRGRLDTVGSPDATLTLT
ncbi:MucR family transcriptional regulator [Blastococcus sp. TML/M2B]|uniref:MucR family transcriptional regulator n=1 Tax=unclassified Blastococcus TaxID=2619396 RepID=UPI00190D5DFF|nr:MULTISPECIES: MucR family transcriptional regulator [unclassified Blastococcus]MBN1091439.1 MucR family transcriptional regulator [Blastococcus sp. TML/M2B]MBN1095007.1 MucR family transcriptional regulator [Blastococcus sp. TML/C7B]